MPVLPLLRRATIANALSSRSLADRASAWPHRLSSLLLRTRNSIAEEANTLAPRQVTGIIPTYYKVDGPTAGTIVGITLGSVAGFLFLMWLLFAIMNPTTVTGGVAAEEEIVVRRHDRSPRSSRRSRHSTHGIEVHEVSRSPRRGERIIVEERRGPRRSRSIVIEERQERRVPGDDIVEVIEDSDITPPRRKSRRSGGGGYRY